MPLYGYRCKECEHEFDKMQKYEDRFVPEAVPCPECFGVEVKYQISTPRIGYSNKGSMRTTDNFNDRLKEIKKKVPEKYQSNINDNIR